jgi:hypothetical protein
MATSKVPAAFRAVYAALVANLPVGTLVIPGPGVLDSSTQKYVIVGTDDADTKSYAHAVTGSQSWAQLGGMIRDETFTIHCTAVAWNGDADALAAMDSVYALMGGIETALVADPSLGGVLLYVPGITSGDLKFARDDVGVAAHLPFDIECKARI